MEHIGRRDLLQLAQHLDIELGGQDQIRLQGAQLFKVEPAQRPGADNAFRPAIAAQHIAQEIDPHQRSAVVGAAEASHHRQAQFQRRNGVQRLV